MTVKEVTLCEPSFHICTMGGSEAKYPRKSWEAVSLGASASVQAQGPYGGGGGGVSPGAEPWQTTFGGWHWLLDCFLAADGHAGKARGIGEEEPWGWRVVVGWVPTLCHLPPTTGGLGRLEEREGPSPPQDGSGQERKSSVWVNRGRGWREDGAETRDSLGVDDDNDTEAQIHRTGESPTARPVLGFPSLGLSLPTCELGMMGMPISRVRGGGWNAVRHRAGLGHTGKSP